MSLINQMLQDLEKRRASSAERSSLPNQVRVLPPVHKPGAPWGLLGIGVVVILMAATAWHVNDLMQLPAPMPLHPVPVTQVAPPAPAPGAAQALVAAPASTPDEAPLQMTGPASRLALDLDAAPLPAARPGARSSAAPAKKTSAPRSRPTTAGDAAAKTAPRAAAKMQSSAKPIASAAVIAGDAAAPAKPAPAAPKPEPAEAAPAAVDTVKVVQPPAAVAAAATAKPVVPALKPVEASIEARAQMALANPQIDKRTQPLSAQQLAENEYRDAANLMAQGRLAEAQEGFKLALQHNPGHTGARQGLFGVLLDAKRNGEAEQVLHDGLRINPNQPNFAILLANLQYERGDAVGAIETLQKTAPAAQGSPDYLARLAGLLQRQARHYEAVAQYQAALRLAPGSGVWWMGLGISLQASNRNAEAVEAFRRAKASNTLNPELQAFIDQRLRQLQ